MASTSYLVRFWESPVHGLGSAGIIFQSAEVEAGLGLQGLPIEHSVEALESLPTLVTKSPLADVPWILKTGLTEREAQREITLLGHIGLAMEVKESI